MAARFFLVLCASALLVQSIAASPCGCGQWRGWEGAEIAYGAPSYAPAPIYALPAYASAAPAYAPAPYSGPAYATKSGGSLDLAAASPLSPGDISVHSDNEIKGNLNVAGSMPFLAGVAFEGAVPSTGSAGTAYSCGTGDVALSAESLASNAISAGYGAPKLIARPAKYASQTSARAGCAPRKMTRPTCGCY